MARKSVLLDTNVLIDFLGMRQPFFEQTRKLMIAARVGEFEPWMSASQVTDLVYILSEGGKKRLVPEVLRRLRTLRLFVNVCPVTVADADAMLASDWSDPEDALLARLALRLKLDAIITRDEDFPHIDGMPVMDCEDFFAWLRETEGVVYEEAVL